LLLQLELNHELEPKLVFILNSNNRKIVPRILFWPVQIPNAKDMPAFTNIIYK